MRAHYICKVCGVQHEATHQPPGICKICSDERQYVPLTGQKWTTLEELKQEGFHNEFVEIEQGLWSIRTYPQVGIGQKAYLIRTDEGNILWDCITYLDEKTINKINELGGLRGIAISHPHYYSTIIEWGNAFQCPIYIHEKDLDWVTRTCSLIHFWNGDSLELTKHISLIHVGGHFEGSSVLLWTLGSNKKGTLLVGDSIYIVPDQGWVSFIYSAPNHIPLSARVVNNIKMSLENYDFEAIYGAFDHKIVKDGKNSLIKSADRYIHFLNS
ncbi:hypothetical protein ACEWK1_00700 [Metabacillus sp. YM-086]|uniref:hypothetical protein n=1 Tax=Metabacillus sp. YM-086 TaxID=3341729 RepID=UPI003A8469FC